MKRLLFLVLVAGIAGCTPLMASGPVNELYVRNSGERAWLVRVPVPYTGEQGYFVAKVNPGADGVAGRWAKEPGPAAQVEVLDLDCQPIAAFRPDGVNSHSVPEAPGLEVSITPWGTHMSRWNTPEIEGLQECGGVLWL